MCPYHGIGRVIHLIGLRLFAIAAVFQAVQSYRYNRCLQVHRRSHIRLRLQVNVGPYD